MLFTLVVLGLYSGVSSPEIVRRLGNLGLMLFAASACASASWTAVRSDGRLRLVWFAFAVANAGFAAGWAVWSYYDLALGRPAPFPGVADLGFLLFPLSATVGMVLFPFPEGRGNLRRRCLDGVIIGMALLLMSWLTVLSAVLAAGSVTTLGLVDSLAYPLGDVVVLTMVVLVMGRAGGQRLQLALLAAGMTAMAVADSGFAYLNATGEYQTGNPIDLGWFAGHGLSVLAALAPASRAEAPRRAHPAARSLPGATYLPHAYPLRSARVGACRGLTSHAASWSSSAGSPMTTPAAST